MSRLMKRSTRRWLTILAVVLVSVTLAGVLGHVTGGFENLFKPKKWNLNGVNKENLYQSLEFADEDGVISDGADGVMVTLNKNHEIKVTGVAESAQVHVIGTYTLQANTSYLFDSSLSNGTKGTIYMAVREVNSDDNIVASYTGPVVIAATELAEDTEVEIVVYVADETSLRNVTLRPILCTGKTTDDLVSFFG